MKKIVLFFVVFATQICFAQNIYPTTGNVGIGTINPISSLEILDGSDSKPQGVVSPTKSILKLSRNGTLNYSYNENAEFRIGHGGDNFWGSKLDLYINGGSNQNSVPDQHVMTWNYNGNVGIGSTNPRSKLEVTDWTTTLTIGSTKNTEAMEDNEVIGAINFYKHYNIGYAGAIKLLQAGGGNQYSPAHLAFYTTSGGNVYTTVPEERMRITSLGNIGIGTTNPDSKLAVNGTIHSKEVKVDMVGWPDYVFKKEYDLPTLGEVEKHINEKGHLENIPSEEQVLKNGINLGEMNAKLLQKIEELTLYMIEMKKENEKVKDENKLMKENQAELERRILKIENK